MQVEQHMNCPAIQMQAIVSSATYPVCRHNISTYPHLIGTRVQFSCSVEYKGMWAPTMQWLNGTNEMNVTSDLLDNTVKFGGVVDLTPWDDEHTYTCRIFFDQPKPGTLHPSCADNLPVNVGNINMTYTMPTLLVYCEYPSHYVANVYIIHWACAQNVNHFDEQARPVE